MKQILLLSIFVFFGANTNAQTFDWAKTIGGTGIDNIAAVAKNPTGIYIVGSFQGTVDFNSGSGVNNLTSNGGTDCFVLKTDFDGNYLWAVSFGGIGNDEAKSVVSDTSGLLLTGDFSGSVDFNPGSGTNISTSNGGTDIFYLKLSNLGTYTYHKTIGGTGNDIATKIAFDGVNIPYLVGSFRNTVDFNPDAGVSKLTSIGVNAFVMKINPSSGGFIWVKDINALSGSTDESYVYGIDFDSSGNMYLGGNFKGNVDVNPGAAENANTSISGTKDVFLVKLDNSGAFVWSAFLQSANDNSITDLVLDSNNDLVIVGNYNGNVNFNPAGSFVLNSASRFVTFIWKLDVNRNLVAAGQFESGGANYCNAVEIDVNNDIYIGGKFRGGMDVDITGVSNVINSSNGSIYDAYLVKLNSALGHVYSKKLDSSNEDEIKDILINNANVFTFGVFQGTIDLNPDAATQYVTSNGDYDIFMQRFTDATLSSTSFSAVDFQIYPNPTSSILNINTDLNNFNYSIYSIDGKIVRQGNSQINQTSIDVSSLISGIYMLDVLTENNERSIQKFIKK